MLCVFCIHLYPTDDTKWREAKTVKNGQASCLTHLSYVPSSTESFDDVLRFIRSNES